MKYKNIKNVKKLTKEKNSFFLEIDIDFDNNGEYETVEYCARPNGGGLCDAIITDILTNKFIGKITNYSYPSETELRKAEEEMVRETRNKLLVKTDWTQLPDVPKAIKTKWAKYRQELRDVTSQTGFPYNVIWPKEPR